VRDKTDIGFSDFADAAFLRTCGKCLAAMRPKSRKRSLKPVHRCQNQTVLSLRERPTRRSRTKMPLAARAPKSAFSLAAARLARASFLVRQHFCFFERGFGVFLHPRNQEERKVLFFWQKSLEESVVDPSVKIGQMPQFTTFVGEGDDDCSAIGPMFSACHQSTFGHAIYDTRRRRKPIANQIGQGAYSYFLFAPKT